jgi:hypothetical protein
MKKFLSILSLILFILLLLAGPVSAEMGMVSTTKAGVDLQIFGSLKTFPHFVDNLDFNDDDTAYDFVLDECGIIDDDEMSVRNEFRLGVKGGGENFKFLAILESDFLLDKENVDRGARVGEISNDIGMTGEDFGVEKLDFSYDFTSHGLPVTVQTGWNTKWLDIETGGVLYGDDHPYIGFKGSSNGISWEVLNLLIYDRTANAPGAINAESPDWRVYSAKAAFPAGDMKISPFYAYSDNNARDANVHYLGLQCFGKMGNIMPKAEFVYAMGEKDNFTATGDEGDISAFAGFASLEVAMADMFNPYLGGYYTSGDDDAGDDKIEAFNPITNISRYAGPFAMENAFIYRYVPALGTHLYSNTFDTLGTAPGYGGISNSSSANSPGMYNLGIGTKGGMDKWSYKAQLLYFWFTEVGALEQVMGADIDDAVGMEFDLQVTYHFTQNFSLGNVISVFDPGDGVQDLRGDDFDKIALLNTVELTWSF